LVGLQVGRLFSLNGTRWTTRGLCILCEEILLPVIRSKLLRTVDRSHERFAGPTRGCRGAPSRLGTPWKSAHSGNRLIRYWWGGSWGKAKSVHRIREGWRAFGLKIPVLREAEDFRPDRESVICRLSSPRIYLHKFPHCVAYGSKIPGRRAKAFHTATYRPISGSWHRSATNGNCLGCAQIITGQHDFRIVGGPAAANLARQPGCHSIPMDWYCQPYSRSKGKVIENPGGIGEPRRRNPDLNSATQASNYRLH